MRQCHLCLAAAPPSVLSDEDRTLPSFSPALFHVSLQVTDRSDLSVEVQVCLSCSPPSPLSIKTVSVQAEPGVGTETVFTSLRVTAEPFD